MRKKSKARQDQGRETQLHAVRDLMLSASHRGAWLTLGEIARRTEIGEASISAQLRHLRKRSHGRHRVEKRVRPARPAAGFARGRERSAGKRRRSAARPTIWEYRVLPPAEMEAFAGGPECEATAQERSAEIGSAAVVASSIEAPQREERCVDVVVMQRSSGEVSDAEARD
jgi:hypothetical protein